MFLQIGILGCWHRLEERDSRIILPLFLKLLALDQHFERNRSSVLLLDSNPVAFPILQFLLHQELVDFEGMIFGHRLVEIGVFLLVITFLGGHQAGLTHQLAII